MFGRMWLGFVTVIGILLMIAAIIFISPLLFAVAICVVIVGLLFVISRLASATAQEGASAKPEGAGSQTTKPDSGGRPVSGEGD